jgi:microsomal dipeptidase-like Zn-dependent dipeptidase
MAHFNHCVEVAGAEHVGIGSDFDGGGGVIGCNGVNDLVNVTVKMLEHGYTQDQIKGFWGGNFMRVMEEVQSKAKGD